MRLEYRRWQVLRLRSSLALFLVLFGGRRRCAESWLVIGRRRLLARFPGRRGSGGGSRLGARLATGARRIDLDNERG